MIKAILFDLDNTLYDEKMFVMSGFRAVAYYISSKYEIPHDIVFTILKNDFENGLRKRNFDVLLDKLNLREKESVETLVRIYRNHKPNIKLYPDAKIILEKFRGKFKLGLITDGYKETQKNKISSLNLEEYFDLIIITDELGKEYWKPCEKPFKVALKSLNIKANECIYVGDNPLKDFIGAKKLGVYTVRVRRGGRLYDNINVNREFDADYTIPNLLCLEKIIDKINNKL